MSKFVALWKFTVFNQENQEEAAKATLGELVKHDDTTSVVVVVDRSGTDRYVYDMASGVPVLFGFGPSPDGKNDHPDNWFGHDNKGTFLISWDHSPGGAEPASAAAEAWAELQRQVKANQITFFVRSLDTLEATEITLAKDLP